MAEVNDAFEMKTTKMKDEEERDGTYAEVTNDAEQGMSSTSKEKKHRAVTKPYAGMGKEELLQFSQTPGWRAARWICILIVLAGWCAMLGMAIFLIVSTPRCLPWWQSAVVYQIFPKSFQDSTDGNGIGDIRGIIDRMDYIESLGINAIMLSSIYKSGGRDNGEDITDFYEVDEDLGSLEDITDLIQALHDRDIKLILDFIPNHSSVDHQFFIDSMNVGTEPEVDPKYQDYYTWANEIYNNWASLYSGSAWEGANNGEKFFLHQYSKYQADFNLNNEDVLKHLSDALETWFTLGVDGFNIRGVRYFYEASVQSADEPFNPSYVSNGSPLQQYDETLHYYTAEYNDDKLHKLLQEWQAEVFYKYSTAGTYRVMLTDSESNSTYVQTYYGTNDDPEADLPMNFNLLNMGDPQGLGGEITGIEIEALIKDWMDKMDVDNWPNFQLGNYASSRIASRLSSMYSKVANLLLLTLPGTPICYYGDEIGMEDITLTDFDQVQDQRALSDPDVWQMKTRDPQRSPMQWNKSTNAGFSASEDPYLPVHPNFEQVNVVAQEDDENSVLHMFRRMVAHRSENRALTSNKITYVESSEEVIAYIRELDGEKSRFFIALNFGNELSEEDFYDVYHPVDSSMLPLQGTIVVATDLEREGGRVELNKLKLTPGEGVVVLLDEIVYVSDGWWFKYFTTEV